MEREEILAFKKFFAINFIRTYVKNVFVLDVGHDVDLVPKIKAKSHQITKLSNLYSKNIDFATVQYGYEHARDRSWTR